jgi:integrase/recombinase XerD
MQVSSRHIDTWLTLQSNLGRAPNTIAAYSFALRDYQQFCSDQNTCVDIASREQVSQYVRNLLDRRVSKSKGISSSLFANATIRQRITVVRLFYDYLIEEGLRTTNPVRRGNQFNNRNRRDIRAIVPIQHKMPWIPNQEEWQRLLAEAQGMSLRNRPPA